MEKNSLNIEITRPEQVLIIMRGVPGAGKSTKAKTLVSEGVIHSTDTIIERSGDYFEFFNKMKETKDYTALSRAHSLCLSEAVTSMKNGVSPVIIDNTNIKMNEPKAYVLAALNLGYSDNNIKFVDVGTSGLPAESLFERNTHGVPLDKIKQMIDSYKTHGKMTLKKVLESKDMYKPKSNVLYSCVLLDKESHSKLLEIFQHNIPYGWQIHAHHMTVKFGAGLDDKNELGKIVNLRVTKIGSSDKAIAVQVEGYPSSNNIPHVTLAVNPDGGNAKDSNLITTWFNVKPFFISGVVTEILKNG